MKSRRCYGPPHPLPRHFATMAFQRAILRFESFSPLCRLFMEMAVYLLISPVEIR